MKKIINRLRLYISFLRKGHGYSLFFIDIFYKIYLNHSKIIHFRDGYPVYSLSTPALFSKSSANFFTRQFYRIIQNRNIPNLMSLAVNDLCNANCEHCSFYEGVDDKSKIVMSFEQIVHLIRSAEELGVSILNIVGGEPLLRPDLADIIKSINHDLVTTTLFTNGSQLAKQAKILKSSGLDGVYVSIDASDAKEHDRIRGKSKLFNAAMNGIKESLNVGLSVGLSCCLTPEKFAEGEFEKIVELGKRIGVHEILIFDAMPTGRMKNRKDLVDNFDWIEKLIEKSKKYNQDINYPGILIYAYTTSHRGVGCACGTSYLYVSPYGEVMPCDFHHVPFGNVIKEPLYKVWDRLTNHADYNHSSWGGCKIKSSDFINKGITQQNTSSGCVGCEVKNNEL